MIDLSRSSVRFDVMESASLDAIVASANVLLHTEATSHAIWPWLDQMDAPNLASLKPGLQLTSLDRVGTEPGRSGSEVWLGTFFPATTGPRVPYASTPLVIKVRRPSNGGKDPLQDENKRAHTARAYMGDASPFAIPVHLDGASTNQHYSVLWSPFSSSTQVWVGGSPSHDDLMNALRHERVEARTYITSALEALNWMHHSASVPPDERETSYGQEYRWYLRSFLDDDATWWHTWAAQWGDASTPMSHDLGADHHNPLWVCSQLKDRRLRLVGGVVHGDLHPRNIVLDHEKRCRIIDFGWSTTDAHITKDFVLLDANLRAMTLPAHVGLQDMAALHIGAGDVSLTTNAVVHHRVPLVQVVQDMAAKRLRVSIGSDEWRAHYTIPLFLVTVGLLRHLGSSDNHLALRHLVLCLADEIGQRL